jgi:hypothetical protein
MIPTAATTTTAAGLRKAERLVKVTIIARAAVKSPDKITVQRRCLESNGVTSLRDTKLLARCC